ncbi:MAG: NAD(P)/FAD-dependent oxidoreductase [Elusimicrobiota bacterium]
MSKKKIIIIGAGPAGLAAGYELVNHKDFEVFIIEKLNIPGGIARTEIYKGNRMDLGGHRFFTKSDNIFKIWTDILPIQGKPSKDDIITGRYKSMKYSASGPDPEKEDNVMLIRKRISRIYFMKNFFDYPVSLNYNTIKNLGLSKIAKISLSYLNSRITPIKNEKSLEDFFINRFGKELYKLFFKDYTEKVWGMRCDKIKPEWGAQRIKGLSISSIIKDILLNAISKKYKHTKKVETTLIRQFYYPKFGPGQMWNEMAKKIELPGGKIIKNTTVSNIEIKGNKIVSLTAINNVTGEKTIFETDYVISSMPIKDLINSINKPDETVKNIANELLYRDFIAVGLLVKEVKIKNETAEKTINNILPDNWIYLQDKGVIAGRLQIFNNWSPYLVKDLNNIWLGVEYFCFEKDKLWNLNNYELINLAIKDLSKIGIIGKNDFIDGYVVKAEKAYPAYFGGYERFDGIKEYLNSIENLYPVGRNGMHKYNNMDHSMITAIESAKNIIENRKDKNRIWNINIEKEYQEEK